MKKIVILTILCVMTEVSCAGNEHGNNVNNSIDNDSITVINRRVRAEIEPEDGICSNPDVRPQYDAEDASTFLVDFLNKNLHYPEEAVAKKVQGTVIVQMVVEKDGTPTHFEVIRKVDPLLDKETLRVAKLLPKFKPAQKDGKPVRCIFNFSVPYRL